ncbi:MAG: tandem-95 repeat protein, partial [Thermoplasmatales archaeon]|nr:tandem-95 repeat protein [Thermoplasmatales archaeon]
WSVSNWSVSLFDSIIVVDNNITFDLKANVYGNNEITITLSDGLLIDSQNIWINVTSVNDPPVIAGLIDQTLIEDVTFWYDITPYISDIDNDISDLVVSTNSSYIIVHNGNHTLEMIYPNGVIVDYVRITVSDGILSSYEDIIFTITPVNDAPVITPAIGNKEGYEDTQFTIDVSGNQYDIDNSIGDLVWSVTVVNTSLFTVSIDQNNDIITITPVANQSGSDTIVIHLSDGLLEATETITITIYPVNDPPVLLNPILDLFLSEGETIYNALNINDYFSDIDSVLSFSYSGNTNVIVTINDDGSVDISVSVGWHGQENITFTAFDEEYNTSYTIAVIVVNNPPSISGVPDQFGVEDIAWALDIISYISDTDNITDDLIITVNSPYVTIDGKVLTFLYPNGIITDSVKITVSDGMATANQTITVTITPVNDAPTISGVPTQYASEDTDLYFDVSSYINDVDNSTDELTISTNSSYATVNGFVITFNYPNGILSENVRITVSDGINTSYQDIMVIVTPVNDAPVIDSFTPISNPTIDEGKEQVFTVSASDVDNADLTITWYLDDSSVVIGNTYTFTSDYTSAGTHTVKVVVSDGSLSDEKTWTLIVNDVKKEEQKSFIPAFEVTTLLIGLGVSVLLIKRRN